MNINCTTDDIQTIFMTVDTKLLFLAISKLFQTLTIHVIKEIYTCMANWIALLKPNHLL